MHNMNTNAMSNIYFQGIGRSTKRQHNITVTTSAEIFLKYKMNL